MTRQPLKLVVTGGGTGGHIYPALAVAEVMQADPDVDSVTYIGKANGLEADIVPLNGIAFEGIPFYGMPREKNLLLPFRLLKWALALQQAIKSARKHLKVLAPDVVFGTGGYVSAPVLIAAKSMKIPYVLHEPDALPGLVNKLMAKDAAVITTSFGEGAEALKHRPEQEVLVTGNPIRGKIGHLSKAEALQALGLDWPADRPVLLITGGSQGARRLNTAVTEALPVLIDDLGFAVAHLTGKKLYDETLEKLKASHPSGSSSVEPADREGPGEGRAPDQKNSIPYYWIAPFSSQMAELLALADIALCRAGSLSLSEMYVCGIPTLLVPYPYAAADHQRKNAQASVRAGASLMIEDAELTGERLLAEFGPLAKQPERLKTMQSAALKLGHPQATQEIVSRLKRFAKGS